jgi:hypothetical protein
MSIRFWGFFEWWFETQFLPCVPWGIVVFLDNARFHRRRYLCVLASRVGVFLVFYRVGKCRLAVLLNVVVQSSSCVWGYLPLYCPALFPCRRFAFRLGSWFLRLSSKAGPILLLIGPYLGALPAYSADFNRIENRLSSMKRALPDLMSKCETLQGAVYTYFARFNS